MGVTAEQIKAIKPGQTKTFLLGSPSACNSAKAMVSYVKRICRPINVGNYKTSTDSTTNAITITAYPANKSN